MIVNTHSQHYAVMVPEPVQQDQYEVEKSGADHVERYVTKSDVETSSEESGDEKVSECAQVLQAPLLTCLDDVHQVHGTRRYGIPVDGLADPAVPVWRGSPVQ